MTTSLIEGIVFWSVLVGLLIVGIIWATRLIRLKRKGIRTEGEIINIIVNESSDRVITYIPIIKFDDQKGKTYEFKSKSNVTSSTKIGEKVEVYYLPDNPEKAANDIGGLMFAAFFIIIICCFTFALVVYEIYKQLERLN